MERLQLLIREAAVVVRLATPGLEALGQHQQLPISQALLAALAPLQAAGHTQQMAALREGAAAAVAWVFLVKAHLALVCRLEAEVAVLAATRGGRQARLPPKPEA